jgi:phage-related minor tail protein
MATIAKGMDILGPGPWSLESAFRAATGLPALAAGGPVTAGMPHIVGERGRELFIPSTDGVIVPHHQSRALMGAGAASDGGTNVTYNVTINGMVGRDKQDILAYLARELPKVAATQARSFG